LPLVAGSQCQYRFTPPPPQLISVSDWDRDGFLSHADLKSSLQRQGLELSKEAIGEVMYEVDERRLAPNALAFRFRLYDVLQDVQ